MLVENGVNIVFHGHDHMYVKEVHRDGIVYQETPTPGGTGEPGDVTVEYIKNIYDCERDCGEVVDSYTIPAK